MTGSPERPAAVPEAIAAALDARDIPRATDLAREALDAGLKHPLLFNLRAYWHEAAGRYAEAFADLRRANELAPEDVSILNALGLAYARAGRLPEAIGAFDAALRFQPDFGPAHFNKGWVSEDLGELDSARAAFARAAALKPDAAEPWARIAGLAARAGDWTEAKDNAERALRLDPRNAVAAQALAAQEIAAGNADAAEERLRTLLARDDLGPLDRAGAEGLLGDALDRRDRTEDAFAAYTRRNAIVREQYAPRYSGPGIQTVPQYLDWVAQLFARMDRAQWLPATEDGEPNIKGHVFLIGFPRSGTTLLEEILTVNPDVSATQERDGLAEAVRDLMAKPADLERLAAMRGGSLARYRRSYRAALAAAGVDTGRRVLLDKQPYNTIKLPIISKLFPHARIVFSIRDPRDVVLSCFRRRFRMNPSNYELLTLDGAARFYDAVMRLAGLYREKLPLEIFDFRHEALVADFDGCMHEVCAFTGIAWTDSMRTFAKRPRARAIATPSAQQVSAGLTGQGIGQWRRYRPQLAPVMPILAPWVEKFGYPAD